MGPQQHPRFSPRSVKMLFVNAGLLALAQVGIASAATPGYQAKPENIVPGAYIVTFEDALVSLV